MAVELEGLELEITTSADQAVSSINALAASLSGLKNAAQGGAGLTTVTKQLERIGSALSAIPRGTPRALTELSHALTTLSQGEYGNSGLNNAARQIQKVNEAIQTLNATPEQLSQLEQVKTALSGLSSVEGASGLNSTVNTLKKLPELSAELDKVDFDRFTEQIKRAAAALEPLASQMDRVSRGFQAFPIRIQKIISSNEGLVKSNQKAARSYGTLNKAASAFNLASFVGGLKILGHLMGQWVSQSNAYVENLNLFTVAMGDAAQEAYDYAQVVKDAVGIDPSDWMRNQGVFMQIASGFGVANDKAVLMSKNLVQLGYDISSYFNINVEEAMQKLQSGISGELEPLRRLGYALDQATLKEVARANGVTKSFNAMTQAEKSQLRYIAIMQQSNNVMGDMARTVLTPANAMRILQQQIQQLTRALGNLLIPFLLKLIPVVQAMVEVLTELINLLANLAGFTLPEIDYSGLGGAAAGAEEVEDSLDAATKAAKKFSETLGIDELNIISPPDQNAGSGAAVGGGFENLELSGYDFLKDLAEGTQDLKDQIKDLLVNYVLPVGAALAAWKIGSGVLSSIRDAKGGLSGWLSQLRQIAGIAIAAGGAVVTLTNAFDAFENGLTNSNLSGMLLGITGLIGGLALAFGPMGAAVGTVAAGVALLTTAFKDMRINGLNSKNLKAIGSFMGILLTLAKVVGPKVTGAIGLISMGISSLITAFDLAKDTVYVDITSMGESFAWLGAAAGALGIAAGVLAGSNPVGWAVGGAVALGGFALTMSTDAIPAVKLFDKTISKATRDAVKPFLAATDDLAVHFKLLKYSETIIDDSVIADTQAKVDTIVETITSNLDATKNERLANMQLLATVMDEEQYQNVLLKVDTYYEGLRTSVDEGQKEINAILSEARDNNAQVSEEGWARINEIEAQLQDVGIQTLSQSQVEYETIMRNLKENSSRISLEQAGEIIQHAQQSRDETIAAAETQYSEILLQAEQLREAGIINEEEYQTMIDAAEEARDETVRHARTQYNDIVFEAKTQLGELVRYIDLENGNILTKWDVWWEDVQTWWNDFWEQFTGYFRKGWDDTTKTFTETIPNWWENDVKPWFGIAKWMKIGRDAIDGLMKGLNTIWENITDWGEDLINTVKDVLGIASPSKEFAEIGEYSVSGLENGFSNMKGVTDTFTNELDVMMGESEQFANTTEQMVDNGLNQFLSALNTARTNNSTATSNMAANYRTMASVSNAAIDSIISKLNAIPRNITTTHTIITVEKSGGSSSSSSKSSSAKGYATGGFPRAGELFYARENGFPELVGQVNGRTAVANNDQIVAAVSQGVAQAVAEVLASRSSGGGQAINIYLDSRQIKAGIERAGRESGATIMSGGGY